MSMQERLGDGSERDLPRRGCTGEECGVLVGLVLITYWE